MRVLWLSHLLPYPPKGGVLQRSYHLLREVAAVHEVQLVALTQKALLPTTEEVVDAVDHLQEVCTKVDVFSIPTDRSRIRWAAMVAANALRSTPYDVTWLRNSQLAESIQRYAREAPPWDLVHLDTLGLAQYVRQGDGAAVVLNHHNIESHMMARRAQASPAWAKWYLRREATKLAALERRVCPEVGMNLVVSDLDASRLEDSVGPVHTRTIPNGVDLEYFTAAAPLGETSRGLVFVGGMSWYPNRAAVLYFLKDIWPALIADDPTRRVTFVGRDPPPELREATKDRRIAAPGFVDDVRPILDSASIYVCPMRDGGGTRLKILDALAMAKPIVATELAVEGIGMIDGQHYLKAETPREFVSQIKRFETDQALRHQLVENGRRLVEHRYSWKSIGRSLHQAYEYAVAAHHNGGGHE